MGALAGNAMSKKQNKSKIKILLVEDHEATLKGLRSELSAEADFEVVGIATTSEEGLNIARNLHPNIVLLDLHLPDSEGPKSLTESYCALKDTRVIIFSGDARAAILQIVLQTGVSGYLLKSEPIAKVADAIRQVASGNVPVISAELDNSHHPKVTGAEQHLLTLLARGMKYQEIGEKRFTSPETVRKQVDALLDKLGVESREALIAWAVDNGYGKLDPAP
ncbi:MAG TPA: response regulator transcription factor [Candidatus Melainabacteria bacterium]|jgi:DNA-binding NarL/FixJ family response regulator|nr:response regulator transcription factor [Candidatus Melainabacteria bacterium]HIN64883.1 response regulator transcription factor [Candidatus Obscuribacterales bacterium]